MKKKLILMLGVVIIVGIFQGCSRDYNQIFTINTKVISIGNVQKNIVGVETISILFSGSNDYGNFFSVSEHVSVWQILADKESIDLLKDVMGKKIDKKVVPTYFIVSYNNPPIIKLVSFKVLE